MILLFMFFLLVSLTSSQQSNNINIHFNHLDFDECTSKKECHGNALCTNTDGSYYPMDPRCP